MPSNPIDTRMVDFEANRNEGVMLLMEVGDDDDDDDDDDNDVDDEELNEICFI